MAGRLRARRKSSSSDRGKSQLRPPLVLAHAHTDTGALRPLTRELCNTTWNVSGCLRAGYSRTQSTLCLAPSQMTCLKLWSRRQSLLINGRGGLRQNVLKHLARVIRTQYTCSMCTKAMLISVQILRSSLARLATSNSS